MKILNFFKSFIKKNKSAEDSKEVLPYGGFALTAEPDKQMVECYDDIFFMVMHDVDGLSEKDVKTIHRVIKECDGGYINLDGYHSAVWEEFFKNREWKWKEYEQWDNRFRNFGKFPSRFPRREFFVPCTIESSLESLKVDQLKSICSGLGLKILSQGRKSDLVEILKSAKDIENNFLVVQKVKESEGKFKFEIYSLLMRTMILRGGNLFHDRKVESLLGSYEIVYVDECDKTFVEMALKINPNATHPVYPSDLSFRKPIFKFHNV